MITPRQLAFLLFVTLFPFTSLLSQRLSFGNLLQIYQTDSTTARKLCEQKGLPLTESGNTGSSRRYQFATPDSAYRLEIRYPNDSASLNTQMNYWFAGAGEYKTIEAGLRKAGFKKQPAEKTGGSLPPNATRYVANALQAELIRPQGIQKSYWLFLHPAGNYNW